MPELDETTIYMIKQYFTLSGMIEVLNGTESKVYMSIFVPLEKFLVDIDKLLQANNFSIDDESAGISRYIFKPELKIVGGSSVYYTPLHQYNDFINECHNSHEMSFKCKTTRASQIKTELSDVSNRLVEYIRTYWSYK